MSEPHEPDTPITFHYNETPLTEEEIQAHDAQVAQTDAFVQSQIDQNVSGSENQDPQHN